MLPRAEVSSNTTRWNAAEMDLEVDLLERRSDGVLTWRGTVHGLAAARAQARQLAVETGNECFVVVANGEEVAKGEGETNGEGVTAGQDGLAA